MTTGVEILSPALPAAFSEHGLTLPEGLSYNEWAEIGSKLQRMNRSVMWWIGDWLNYGARAFGEKYTAALEETPYAKQTLTNASYVAEHVPISRRRETLTWTHHAEVASKDPEEQERLLAEAEENRWSTRTLRLAASGKLLANRDDDAGTVALDDETPDRLLKFELFVGGRMKVKNPETRMRGDKEKFRESIFAEPIVFSDFDIGYRRRGFEGFRQALSEAAGKAYHDPGFRADWENIPGQDDGGDDE